LSNPLIQHLTVTDTARQVVSEPDKYFFQSVTFGGIVYLGNASVSPATPQNIWANTQTNSSTTFSVEFEADAELWAVAPTGQSYTLKVVRWF
jgi:uncharacterized protein YfiM (DUF2279 family)